MAAKKSTRKPKPDTEPEPESEAHRLQSLAVSRLRSSAFKSALKYARRARRLSPSLPSIDLMVTALKILRSSPDDHYSVLLLPPLSPSSLITTHFQTLTLTLTQSSSSVPGAADAIARLNHSFSFLSDPDRKARFDARFAQPGSFWTACTKCRLLHEFDRKYLGHRLLCPSCNKTFLANENDSSRVTGTRSKSRTRPRIREKTLAEMQMEIMEERRARVRGLSLMEVEEAEFYDFDTDREEKRVVKGQVWAVYDEEDGMPRRYGLVDDVVSVNPFRVKMSLLDVEVEEGRYVACGRFKVGRQVKVDSVNMLSHLVACERAAREVYRIYPKKGSVWALYAEEGEERKYDIVVFLTSYSEMYGMSMAYLEKVEGFKAIFKRREIGCHAVRLLEKDNHPLFSHQLPARKLSGKEDENLPTECWELDPASLPSDMLNKRIGYH